MQGRKTSDPIRLAAERRPDPQLRADMRDRVQRVRDLPTKNQPEYRPSGPGRQITESRSTRIKGSKKRLQPTKKNDPDLKLQLEDELVEAPTVGVVPQHRRKPTPRRSGPSVAPDPRARTYRERVDKERRDARREGRKPRFATEQEVKQALKEVADQQRSRSGQLDQSGAGRIRASNDRARQTTPRQSDIKGHRLPPEQIQNPSPEMPNIAKPPSTDGRWESSTSGTAGNPSAFRSGSGELKGVSERGRVKSKGRSESQTRKAQNSVKRIKARRAAGKPLTTKKPKTEKAKSKKAKQMEAIRLNRQLRRRGLI
jgi:hypothetical protein